jgi:thioesterase domain-containing protein/acyl carrier protein
MLGLERVGIHDNFFDLGGHSLLAARMFAKIQETFGKKLPLSTLFHGATIQHMASIIDEPTQSNRWSSLVAIQPQGTRPPFFCIHELSGDVLCYMNLARHLGQDQPLYALQARGLDGAEEPFDSIEAMSAYYVEAIRNVQPKGPYALGGLSFGGTVAFEMAQQLCAKGEPVAMVALLDSNAEYDKVTWQLSSLPKLFRDLPSWLIGSFQLNRSQWHDLIRLKFKRARARLGVSFRSAPELSESYAVKLIKEMGDLFHFSEQHRKVALVQYQARKRYRPRLYPGRLTLFRARMQPLLSSHDPENGWGRLAAGGLDIRVVPGNHLGMLQEPHVQVLAELLKLCLEQSLDAHDTENRVDPGLRPVQ